MSITLSEIKRVRNKTAGVANIYIDSRTAHELCDLAESASQLTADKRELVEALESIEFKCRVALDETGGLQAVRNLIAKHKEGV